MGVGINQRPGLPRWFSGKAAGLPVQEMQVQPLGQDNPPGKGLATRSSTPARETSWTRETGVLQAVGSHSQTRPHDSTMIRIKTRGGGVVFDRKGPLLGKVVMTVVDLPV